MVRPGNLSEDSATFGELLAFHLFEHGTRPDGSPHEAGRPWKLSEFAEAIGSPLRTVRNWPNRSGEVPTECLSIERVLFGKNPVYRDWRVRLRRRHREGRRRNSKRLADLGGIPPELPLFVGRAYELAQLHALLTESYIPTALYGLPGSGKTAVAAMYAHRSQHLYAGIWWCTAETRAALVGSLWALAVALNIASPREKDAELAAQKLLMYFNNQERDWLLIYDNVPGPIAIKGLIPRRGARIVVTSRFQYWSTWAKELSVSVFAPATAVQFLQTVTQRDDPSGAEVLARTLDCLPLALDHAAATCAEAGLTFQEYSKQLQKFLDVVQENLHYPRSVYATFCLAIAHAGKGRDCRDIITYLSFCSPDHIPMVLIEGVLHGVTRRVAALKALHRMSLITYSSSLDGHPSINVHRVVQAVGRSQAESVGSDKVAISELCKRLFLVFPKNIRDPDDWPVCEQFVPHVVSLNNFMKASFAPSADWAGLLNRCGLYLRERSQFSQAEALVRSAVQISESSEGHTNSSTAIYEGTLALLRKDQGDLTTAESEITAAIKRANSVANFPPSDGAGLLNIQAEVHLEQGRVYDAIELMRHVESVLRFHFGEDHIEYATALNNLGNALVAAWNFRDGETYISASLTLRRRWLGELHPDTLSSLFSLVSSLFQRGQLEPTYKLAHTLLTACIETLGEPHPDTLRAANLLARVEKQMKNFEKAEDLLAGVLQYLRAFGQTNHPFYAETLYDLAEVRQTQSQLPEAENLYNQALAIFVQAYSDSHPAVARTLTRMGDLLSVRGELAAAQQILDRAELALQRNASVATQGDRAELHTCLGDLHVRQKDVVAARMHYEAACEIWELLSPDSVKVAHALFRLANFNMEAGEVLGVETMFRRAIEIYDRNYPKPTGATVVMLVELARFLTLRNKLAEARVVISRALQIREAEFGSHHPEIAPDLLNLGQVLHGLGDYSQAEAVLARGSALFEGALGQAHPNSLLCVRWLAETYISANDLEKALELCLDALDRAEKSDMAESFVPLFASMAIHCLTALGRASEAAVLRKRVVPYMNIMRGSEAKD